MDVALLYVNALSDFLGSLLSIAMSLSLILTILGFPPFLVVMWMVLVLKSISLHFSCYASSLRVALCFKNSSSVAIWNEQLAIKASISFSCGIQRSFASGLYRGRCQESPCILSHFV